MMKEEANGVDENGRSQQRGAKPGDPREVNRAERVADECGCLCQPARDSHFPSVGDELSHQQERSCPGGSGGRERREGTEGAREGEREQGS